MAEFTYADTEKVPLLLAGSAIIAYQGLVAQRLISLPTLLALVPGLFLLFGIVKLFSMLFTLQRDRAVQNNTLGAAPGSFDTLLLIAFFVLPPILGVFIVHLLDTWL